MISLSENRTALINLKLTIEALDKIRKLIAMYSEDKPGPAYVRFAYAGNVDVDADDKNVQIDRPIMVTALKAQEQKIVSYLASLGIDANSESE